MGFFDRFRKKKPTEEQPAAQEAALESEKQEATVKNEAEVPAAPVNEEKPAETPAQPEMPTPVPDENTLRGILARGLVQAAAMKKVQQTMLDHVCTALGLEMQPFEEAINMMWTADKLEGDMLVASAGKLAAALAQQVKAKTLTDDQLNSMPPKELMRTWPELDYYGTILGGENVLITLRNRVRDAMMTRKLLTVRASTPMEKLQFQLNKLLKEKAAPDAVHAVNQQIWAELLKQEQVLVAFDEDHNANFPFSALDGALMLFLDETKANQVRAAAGDSGEGHFSLRKLENAQLERFIQSARMTGYPAIRIYTAGAGTVLPMRELPPITEPNMMDQYNRTVRGFGLRTMQYNARINKMNASLRGTEKHRQLTAAALTMRANFLRELGNTLVYVLGPAPYTPGVTLYTPEALARAKELLGVTKMPEESLIAPGDRSIAVYEGKLALRAIAAPGNNGDLKQSSVCAFTQRSLCEAARKHYESSGAGDSVILVTWDELAAQAESCAGVVLDPAALSVGVPVAWFPEVEKFRAFKTPIVVNLQDKNNPNGQGPKNA